MNKPPFSAINAAQRKAMTEWVHGVLNEYYEEYYHDDVLREAEEECRTKGYSRLEMPYAMKAWRQGDTGPLRRLYPEIAETIQPPRLAGQGRRRPRPGQWDHVRATEKLIKLIWASPAYYGRRRRRATDGPSAREIAAAYHGVDESAVSWKLGGKHKPGSRSKKVGRRRP
jgi:hypothetical protein